jgi:hypothetical protein
MKCRDRLLLVKQVLEEEGNCIEEGEILCAAEGRNRGKVGIGEERIVRRVGSNPDEKKEPARHWAQRRSFSLEYPSRWRGL